MPTQPADAWKRLGELLVARRVQLDPRYRNRRVFAEERGLNYKLVSDLENASRTNFGREVLAEVEIAYRWQAGSIRQVLANLEPTPETAASEAERKPKPTYPSHVAGDPFLEYIHDYPGDDASPRVIYAAIRGALLGRELEGGRGQQSAARHA